MTPADPPDDTADDTADDQPITPEVVDGGGDRSSSRRGAAARKRRMGPGPGAGDGDGGLGDSDGAVPPGRVVRPATGRLFRAGCLLLAVLGLFELLQFSRWIYDSDGVRCQAAEIQIDDANDNDDDFDDVALPEGVEDADELGCEQAIALAGNIPEDEDDEPDGEFISASAFRTQGFIFVGLGLIHAVSGFMLLRTKNRRWRTAALISTVLSVLTLSQFGIIGIAAIFFIVYAIVFSADAKAIFGPTGSGGGILRPRPPREACRATGS